PCGRHEKDRCVFAVRARPYGHCSAWRIAKELTVLPLTQVDLIHAVVMRGFDPRATAVEEQAPQSPLIMGPKGRTIMRRTILPAAVAARVFAIAPPFAAPAAAQPYPNRPVKIIVPTPAGGPVDVMARLLANALPPVLGQNVIVENRAGAGNTLGSKVAAAADPDGYTLLVSAASGLIMSPMVYKSAGYDENRLA